MRGNEILEAMAVIVDCLMNASESSASLNRVIKNMVGSTSQFSGKEVTNYLDAYKAKMLMRNISEERQLNGFAKVVAPSIHIEVLVIQADCCDWGEFKEWLLKRYNLDNSLRLSTDLMDWVKLPEKGRKKEGMTLGVGPNRARYEQGRS